MNSTVGNKVPIAAFPPPHHWPPFLPHFASNTPHQLATPLTPCGCPPLPIQALSPYWAVATLIISTPHAKQRQMPTLIAPT